MIRSLVRHVEDPVGCPIEDAGTQEPKEKYVLPDVVLFFMRDAARQQLPPDEGGIWVHLALRPVLMTLVLHAVGGAHERFQWVGISKDIESFVQGCLRCRIAKGL